MKTAADKFVNTPNNVSIDGYGCADLSIEPVVVSVPTIKENRRYIVQIGDDYDHVVYSSGAARAPNRGAVGLIPEAGSGPRDPYRL